MSDKLTYEQAIADVLSPWFDKDVDLGAGQRIATTKDAAVHGFVAAMNTDDSQRGVVRILVRSAEEKREIHGYLTAFFSDAPRLKQMRLLKKTTPDAFFLTSGVNIVIDTNVARLAKNVLAQIIVDPTVAEPIGTVWLEVDGDVIESKEAACIRSGFDPSLIDRLMFVRWMTRQEAGTADPPPWDQTSEPGPPQDPEPEPRVADPDQLVEQKLKRRQAEQEAEERYHAAVEARRREETAEKIAGHFSKIRQRGV